MRELTFPQHTSASVKFCYIYDHVRYLFTFNNLWQNMSTYVTPTIFLYIYFTYTGFWQKKENKRCRQIIFMSIFLTTSSSRVPTNWSKFFFDFPGFPGNFSGFLPEKIQIFSETSTWLFSLQLNRNNININLSNNFFLYYVLTW